MSDLGGPVSGAPFRVNQKVVYPMQGVGLIRTIEEKTFRGKSIQYYQIYFKGTDMTVLVPVEKCEEMGIRAIVEQEKAREALDIISQNGTVLTTDWKIRYQLNLDLLKTGGVTDIALVVRNLYHRSKIKELPILERKLFDSALKVLIDEVAFSLDLDLQEVEDLIFSKLEIEREAANS